jgi:hypothetical protein
MVVDTGLTVLFEAYHYLELEMPPLRGTSLLGGVIWDVSSIQKIYQVMA